MQAVIVAMLFLGALAYLGSLFFNASKGGNGCASNCNCESKKTPAHLLKGIQKPTPKR